MILFCTVWFLLLQRGVRGFVELPYSGDGSKVVPDVRADGEPQTGAGNRRLCARPDLARAGVPIFHQISTRY